MNEAAVTLTEDEAMRERRCIVTGAVLPEADLIRFVAGPEGEVTPDLAAKLPGRGLWVRADRATVEKAVAKNHFAKAARAGLRASPDLPNRLEMLLVQRMGSDLGLARRSGLLILGFDQVLRAFEARVPPIVLLEASDGGQDGRRKLTGAAKARGLPLIVLECLDSREMSLALGRENVIHAALKPGRLAERLIFDAGRLAGFRPCTITPGHAGTGPASVKGTDE